MTHRIVVLGAGYAGLVAAKRLARQLPSAGPDGAEVVVVNAATHFVQRPRLHQVATGQEVREKSLNELLAGTEVRLVVGWVDAIDTVGRHVTVLTANGPQTERYDTLVYALGSTIDTSAVPGVAAHAYVLSDPDAAQQLNTRLTALPPGGTVVVCGGGLTGIEIATEIAERYPALSVRLLSRAEPGARLTPKARDYLRRAFDRLRVAVTSGVEITQVHRGGVALAGGEDVTADVVVWAGGFTVPPLARQAGLSVDRAGRALVDETFRSVSHPDVYVIGDAAAQPGPWGDAMAFGCRVAGFMGPYLADTVADVLAGKPVRSFRYRYIHQCISLGRKDAVIQFVHGDDESPRRLFLSGRLAVLYKETVLWGATLLFRWPGPYLPRRRRVTATAASVPAV